MELKDIYAQTADSLYQLYDRWQDEKEYEDFNDYKAVVCEMFKAIGIECAILKKPFNVVFMLNGKKTELLVRNSGIKSRIYN